MYRNFRLAEEENKKMKTKLIVMLTHHDKTVTNALETFNQVKDLEVDCWGFKDVGIPRN